MATPELKSRGPNTEHSILSPARKTISAAVAGGKKRHSYKPLPKEFRRDRFCFGRSRAKGTRRYACSGGWLLEPAFVTK